MMDCKSVRPPRPQHAGNDFVPHERRLRMRKLITGAAGMAFGLLISSSVFACNTSNGEVTKIDSKSNTIAVAAKECCGSGGDKTMTFTLKNSTKVLINGKEACLADLKQGDKVRVDYEKTDDVLSINATRES